VNALTNAEVGNYLNSHFVASYQKVGTFRIVNGQKQGGNVASYFCTPSGQVLHVVTGPVKAEVLLREARWVVETWKLAELEKKTSVAGLKKVFGKAHTERLELEYGYRLPPKTSAQQAQGFPQLMNMNMQQFQLANMTMRQLPVTSPQGRVHLLLAQTPLPPIDKIYRTVFENFLGERVSTSPVEGTERSR
jgi:hypothetical protein